MRESEGSPHQPENCRPACAIPNNAKAVDDSGWFLAMKHFGGDAIVCSGQRWLSILAERTRKGGG